MADEVQTPAQRTRVGHCKKDEVDVYVGRGSIWGNPFVRPGAAKKSRYQVREVDDPIGEYRRYVMANDTLMSKIGQLRGKRLGCFCKRLDEPDEPIRCHGQVLAEIADGIS